MTSIGLASLSRPLAGLLMISAACISPALAAPGASMAVTVPATAGQGPIETVGWRCAYRWHGGCWRHRVWRHHYWRYY
jgi:hypothetical protein